MTIISFLFCHFTAPIHHVILEYNKKALMAELRIEPIIQIMEDKDATLAQNIQTLEDIEDKREKCIEWLQWQPIDDYKTFRNLLFQSEETAQKGIALSLATSCENYMK